MMNKNSILDSYFVDNFKSPVKRTGSSLVSLSSSGKRFIFLSVTIFFFVNTIVSAIWSTLYTELRLSQQNNNIARVCVYDRLCSEDIVTSLHDLLTDFNTDEVGLH